MKAQFKFLSGARAGQVEAFGKTYIGLGRHPLSDVRFDAERDLDVSSRHAAVVHKGDSFVLQDLGSRNGTFVNGKRITGDTPIKDGDVIGFGANGPALEFHAIAGAASDALATTAAEGMAVRASSPRQVIPASATPSAAPRSSTAVRIAVEVARQTAQLRRTTKVLIGFLLLTVAAFGWLQWQTASRNRELLQLQARTDSLMREARQLSTQFQSQCRLSLETYGNRTNEFEGASAESEKAAKRPGGKEKSSTSKPLPDERLMRAIGGGFLWMMGMFSDLQTVPTVADVWGKAQCAIRWPSAWTIAKSVFTGFTLGLVPQTDQVSLIVDSVADPTAPLYCLPVDLKSGQRLLGRVEIIVGPAHGAEMLLSGIRAIYARHPTKPKQEFLTQVLASGSVQEP